MENLGNSSSLATNTGDYVPLVPYNGTTPTGGDSQLIDLNVFYQSGDISWIIMSTALVLLMIPGVGYGQVRSYITILV